MLKTAVKVLTPPFTYQEHCPTLGIACLREKVIIYLREKQQQQNKQIKKTMEHTRQHVTNTQLLVCAAAGLCYQLTLTWTMLGCFAFSNMLISRREVMGNPSLSFSIFNFFSATISPKTEITHTHTHTTITHLYSCRQDARAQTEQEREGN